MSQEEGTEPRSVLRASAATAILRSLEGEPEWRTPNWADLGFTVIDRGRYAIFPLAGAPVDDGTPGDPGTLADDADRLRRYCVHRYGGDFFHAEPQLDLDAGYGLRLREAGPLLPAAVRPPWWRIGGLVVLVIRSIDPGGAIETLALHALPGEWFPQSVLAPTTKREISRARSMLREQEVADASWAWPIDGADIEAEA